MVSDGQPDSGNTSSKMKTVFSLDNDSLGRLDAAAATKAFRNLLWCEARRAGLSPHKIVISLRTNVSDGGIDARVDGSTDIDSVLVGGATYFQVKAGESFKPWHASSLKKELFGSPKAKPSREALASEVCECFRLGGQYVLVTFGHDLTPQQQALAKTALCQLFEACEYKRPQVDVLGQSQLLGLFASFPSLALELLGSGDLPFQNLDGWKAQSDMTPLLHLAAPQSEVIEKIRVALHGTDYQHIRVIGEPGIGKTRLVLEALSAEDLAPAVIYVAHAEDFQHSRLFNELLHADVGHYGIIVIDECVEKERASIWNALKGKKNIRLMTIDHGPERSRDDEMLVIECPQLPEDQIKAIIASYLPKPTDVSHWARWCDGSPRVAHAVGENLQRTPEDLLKPPAIVPMWERFVAGYDRLDSKSAQDALTVLRHVALFTRFGFEEPVSGEAKFIAELVQEVDPSITWARFQEVVGRLRERRILQGKRTLFIVPKALHIYLWIGYWNTYAQDIVNNILSSSGPFARPEFLVSEAGTRFLNYLAEAEPAATLGVLERTFSTWSQGELKRWETGRQDIVCALEKIAVWREHFFRAANLLVKLALAENSNYGNNSTGTLLSLFKIGVGWAGTQAPPEERFPVIRELLDSHELARKELGLSLCESWLSTHGGFRIVGAEFQGLRPELEFWRPKVWGEVFEAWRLVWRHLFSVSRTWSENERRLASRTLTEAGAQLLYCNSIASEVMETLFQLADDSATDIRHLTATVIRELKFRTEKLPKGIPGKLRDLDKKLTGSSFWGRFSRYVLNTTWDEDYKVRGDDIEESNLLSRKVQKLAVELRENASLFAEYLPKFVVAEGHRLYEFGSKLAETLHSPEMVEAVTSAQLTALPETKTQFIGGYFSGLKEHSPELWESVVFRLLDDGPSREIGVAVVLRSGVSPSVLAKLVELYRQGHIKAAAFSRLAWEAEPASIPQAQVEEVLAALVDSPSDDALRVAIELTDYYFFDKKQPRSCDENLLFGLLTADGFFRKNPETMTGYHWRSVAKGFLERFPGRDLELFSVILSHLGDLSSIRSMNYPSQIGDEIAKAHPVEAWSMVSKLLESDERNSFWVLSWLGDDLGFGERAVPGAIRIFDPEAVMAWVSRDPENRARKLLDCLPKTLDENDGGTLTRLFLETFGDNDNLSSSLMWHFDPGGRSGPESAYLSRKRDRARQWISKIKSGKVLSWLYRYIDFLNRRIAEVEIREERGF